MRELRHGQTRTVRHDMVGESSGSTHSRIWIMRTGCPVGAPTTTRGASTTCSSTPAKLRVEAIAHGSAYSPYEVAIDLKPPAVRGRHEARRCCCREARAACEASRGRARPPRSADCSGARHQPLPAVVEGVPHVLLVSRRCGSLQAYCGCLLRNGEDDRRGPDVGLPLQGR